MSLISRWKSVLIDKIYKSEIHKTLRGALLLAAEQDPFTGAVRQGDIDNAWIFLKSSVRGEPFGDEENADNEYEIKFQKEDEAYIYYEAIRKNRFDIIEEMDDSGKTPDYDPIFDNDGSFLLWFVKHQPKTEYFLNNTRILAHAAKYHKGLMIKTIIENRLDWTNTRVRDSPIANIPVAEIWPLWASLCTHRREHFCDSLVFLICGYSDFFDEKDIIVEFLIHETECPICQSEFCDCESSVIYSALSKNIESVFRMLAAANIPHKYRRDYDLVDLSKERKYFSAVTLGLVRWRTFDICVALRDLPAWILVHISRAATFVWNYIPLHHFWNIAIIVKHFDFVDKPRAQKMIKRSKTTAH